MASVSPDPSASTVSNTGDSNSRSKSTSKSSMRHKQGADDMTSEKPPEAKKREGTVVKNTSTEKSSSSPTVTTSKSKSSSAPTDKTNTLSPGEGRTKSSSLAASPASRLSNGHGHGTGEKSRLKRLTKPPSSKKKSFWSAIFIFLVPCAAPSPTHPVHEDVDDTSSSEGRSSSTVPPVVSKSSTEKPAPNEAPHSAESSSPTSPPSPKKSPVTITTSTPPTPVPSTTNKTSKLLTDVPLVGPPPSQPPPTAPRVNEINPAVVVSPAPTTLLPKSETSGVTSGAVQPPGSTGAPTEDSEDGSSFTDDDDTKDVENEDEEENRLILNGGAGIPIGPDGIPRPLLPPLATVHKGRKCLVLDLDETLVHSSFKLIPQADYVVPVEIEWQWHNVYVIKRPGVDNFLKKMGEIYEVVVFTASLSKYADPVLDKLDIHKVVAHRLFRESCYNHKGNYVKDLSQLGRPIQDTIILDNSPASYIFHPNNAVPVSSWFNDPHDTELTDLCPFLTDLSPVSDVRGVLDGGI